MSTTIIVSLHANLEPMSIAASNCRIPNTAIPGIGRQWVLATVARFVLRIYRIIIDQDILGSQDTRHPS
jgi:hypothetical protein